MRGEIYTKMQKILNQFILEEGYSKIAVTFGVTLFLFFLGFSFFGKIGVLITLLILWIYRNNQSIIHNPANLSDTIYAPIDGKIASIDKSEGKQKVYIDVNFCGSHILRAPMGGVYTIDSLVNGLNLSSWTFKSRSLNSKGVISFKDNFDDKVNMEVLSGFCGAKIALYPDNKEVATREPIGVFIQGTIIVEIPATYEIKVYIGDKVTGGISVLAGKIE
jgi:phosphatidylserine decarboxylase